MKKNTESQLNTAASMERPHRPAPMDKLPTGGGLYRYDSGTKVMTQEEGPPTGAATQGNPATTGGEA